MHCEGVARSRNKRTVPQYASRDSLEGDASERPRINLHFASRAPWYEAASGL